MKKKQAVGVFLGAIIVFLTVTLIVTVTVLTYSKVANAENADYATFAIVMFLVILFITTVFTLVDVLRRRLTVDEPLENILQATDKIASGDFSVRITPLRPYGDYSALGEITRNLNAMASALSKSEILHADFISNVSHELKTPLAVIRNYAAALKDETLDKDTRTAYCATLISATDRLTALVGNILQLNKLENNQLTPEKKYFDLSEHLAQSVLNFEDSIERKQLELICDLEECTIHSSPALLEIVWNNLLSNAIKFTESGGTITVSLKKEHGKTRVCVADTGVGISPETGARIFDKFYQGDTSHASEGNGLGLALAKKVIELLGGEISVVSEIGKGSAFTVTL